MVLNCLVGPVQSLQYQGGRRVRERRRCDGGRSGRRPGSQAPVEVTKGKGTDFPVEPPAGAALPTPWCWPGGTAPLTPEL